MRIISIGLMLFALFFGSGNLIFPVMLGQESGASFIVAVLGFMTTCVLLPLSGVVALAVSGTNDFLEIVQRNGKIFALIFVTILYLTIGPLFVMPRTGSVSYEIALKPFVNDEHNTLMQFIFMLGYFILCCLLSLNPNKIIDIIGKFLTPLMLIFIALLVTFALLFPMSSSYTPAIGEYAHLPFITGFKNGYLTMDTLASFIFGVIVVHSFARYGVHNKSKILLYCVAASLIAACVLALIYLSLSFIGASSVNRFGILDNGGAILTQTATYYFGVWGNIILGVIATLACLTTAIGLTNACANYIHKLLPYFSYRQYVIFFAIISALFANVGLSSLIQFSIPVLVIIYPIIIVFIVLTFTHHLFNGSQYVYYGAIYSTLIITCLSELSIIHDIPYIHDIHLFLYQHLPFYASGLSWIIPAIVGTILGYIYHHLHAKITVSSNH